MQHETVTVFAHDGINDLFVLLGTQRSNNQGLCFTTGKQGTAVRTGQYTQTNANRTYGAGIAAVDTRLAIQDLTTHQG